MKKPIILLLLIIFFICTMTLFSFDFPAFSRIKMEELVEHFNIISSNNPPGLSIFNKIDVRIQTILNEFPIELDDNDINNLRSTLQSMGFNPNNVSQFGYKIEYKFPSVVDWQDELRLVFFIQNVQRPYFERDFKLNDTIYWFASYRQLNTFSQTVYFIVSVFLNEEYLIYYNIE